MSHIVFALVLICSFAHGQEKKASTSSSSKEGKFAQVYINPIGAAFGLIDLGADLSLGDRFSLGPALMAMSYTQNDIFIETTYKGIGFGGRATWQFNGTSIGTGWVLSAAYVYFPKVTATGKQGIISFSNNEYTTEYSQAVSTLVFGYRWLWWGHMSLKVAAGVRHSTAPEKVTMTSGSSTLTVDQKASQKGLNPGGEAMLGFAF